MEVLLEQAVVGASSWSSSGYPGKANPRNDLQPPCLCFFHYGNGERVGGGRKSDEKAGDSEHLGV